MKARIEAGASATAGMLPLPLENMSGIRTTLQRVDGQNRPCRLPVAWNESADFIVAIQRLPSRARFLQTDADDFGYRCSPAMTSQAFKSSAKGSSGIGAS